MTHGSNILASALWFCGAVYLGGALERDAAAALSIGGATPALVSLVGCLWIAVRQTPYRFLVLGLCGLWTDLTGPGRLGPGLAAGLLVGYALMRWLEHGRRSAPRQLAGVALGVTLIVGLESLLAGLPAWPTVLPRMAATALTTGVYTALWGAPLVWWSATLRREPRLGRV